MPNQNFIFIFSICTLLITSLYLYHLKNTKNALIDELLANRINNIKGVVDNTMGTKDTKDLDYNGKNFDNLQVDFNSLQKYWINKFFEVGTKHGIDKISYHNYHPLYGKYAGPLRNIKSSILEIGLGCGMGGGYTPGRSLLTWREYLPKAKITYLEYDKTCGESFRSQVDNLYIGDQSSFGVLEQVGGSGPYDLIVDDGGHSRKQQINSLIGLWPYLKAGGVYIVEDMMYSFVRELNDDPDSMYDVVTKFLVLFNDPSPFPYTNISPKIDIRDEMKRVMDEIVSIDCFRRACAFIKKG